MMTRSFTAPAALAAAMLIFGGAAAPVSGASGNSTARAESTEAGSAAPAKTQAQPKKVRYCFVDVITGSHLPQKVCRTKEQWEALGVDVPAQ